MYEKDFLKDYIKGSELRTFNNKIKIRLSKELSQKYDNGIYNLYLKDLEKCFNLIESLGIKYPSNANPILYVYIVPDDNYLELLRIPKIFDSGKGGGKPVNCYDLDGFNYAYGLSQNILENRNKIDINIERFENLIHELSHIVHSQFFSKIQTISEGVAEALPLYILNLEKNYDDYINQIINLDENQILSVKELLEQERNKTFGEKTILPNRSCSFRLSYISSYLFVRGCIERIIKNNNCSKPQALQYFLEIVKQSSCTNEWLIYDIANSLGLDKDELLNNKTIQMNILKTLKNEKINIEY